MRYVVDLCCVEVASNDVDVCVLIVYLLATGDLISNFPYKPAGKTKDVTPLNQTHILLVSLCCVCRPTKNCPIQIRNGNIDNINI